MPTLAFDGMNAARLQRLPLHWIATTNHYRSPRESAILPQHGRAPSHSTPTTPQVRPPVLRTAAAPRMRSCRRLPLLHSAAATRMRSLPTSSGAWVVAVPWTCSPTPLHPLASPRARVVVATHRRRHHT
ncbi:hypothetical protein VPH35_002449 [Triticum aestivum]